MTRPLDQTLLDQLSAYIDGALPPAHALAIERLLETDPAVAAEFAALLRADQAVLSAFDGLLAAPVPVTFASAFDRVALAELPQRQAANIPSPPHWRSLAAALVLLIIGGAGGAYMTRAVPGQVASTFGWLDQVADYHLIYANQKRHLVEVPASDSEHLQKWLSDTTGVAFTVPDLSANGLTFQGGRLLVASAKPVAQLLYTDGTGQVVALCFLAGGNPSSGTAKPAFQTRTARGLNMVWWNSNDASYVVVGPSAGVDLQSVAKAASMAL